MALAKALEVPTHSRPAFAARLRHLRNLGVPKEKPGSGKRQAYSDIDVNHMFVALLLESLGCSPAAAVAASHLAARRGANQNNVALALLPKGKALLMSIEAAPHLVGEQPAIVLVNLDRAAAIAAAALAEAGRSPRRS